MGKYTKKLEEVHNLVLRLQKDAPNQIESFNQFMKAVEKPSALSLKQKELINVALAVVAQCEWCIPLHVKGAIDAGANRAEIIDAAMQAVLMHGGPALVYLTPVEEAIDEFLEGED